MQLLLGFFIFLATAMASPSSHAVVARPEVSNANFVHVGQTLVIPLYDGEIASPPSDYAEILRRVGRVRIGKHDLRRDLGNQTSLGPTDVVSDRGEAFVVKRAGRGSINVLLRLPQLHQRCVSCRTLHFFFHAT